MKRDVAARTIAPSAPASKSFLVHFFIRGRLGRPFLTAECVDIEAIVAKSAETFRSFSSRNPWIFSDSVRRTAWVFLDPETSTNAGCQQ
jgi:hypothetical protein